MEPEECLGSGQKGCAVDTRLSFLSLAPPLSGEAGKIAAPAFNLHLLNTAHLEELCTMYDVHQGAFA